MSLSPSSFQFPQGLPGFENLKDFLLVPVLENRDFYWLHAKDDTNVIFLLVDPFAFFPDYELKLNKPVREMLSVTKQEEVSIYTIVTITDNNYKKATTNLLGPLIFNNTNKQAVQLVLEGTSYQTKHLLFSPLKASACG
jgi:flagellar assembly factor FliW